jgi:hypothetical protein
VACIAPSLVSCLAGFKPLIFYCIKVKTVKKYSFFQIVATAIVARDEKTEKCKHQRPNVADTARLAASGS